jgi:excisionase family DNA binding protein
VREVPLSKFGLYTVEEAARERGVSARTVQRWIENEGIAVVPVGPEGRNRKYLVIANEVVAYEPGPVGAPEGNRNAIKVKKPKRKKKGRAP